MDNLVIRGIDGINNVTLRQDIRIGSKKEWLVDTAGSNIVDTMLHPEVDKYRTFSNDIHEMYHIFGIESARNTLIREIREVMDEASEIDPRHIHLLVDMMTTKGVLVPIDRNGMKLTDVGPLAKCSFEEADQQLYKAAIYGETDNITGVSSNIILGQAPPCGTGTVNVSLNEEHFNNLMNHHFDSDKSNTEDISTEVIFDFDE
jgi:DNA-directed RNA polymerase II subunit RPB1